MTARKRSWPVPVALVARSATPLTARTLRLIQLAGGPAVIPADHRFAGFPIALVARILGATTFALGGILQLAPRFRRRHAGFTEGFGGAIFGTGVLAADLAKGAGWVINLAVAESALRRPARRRLAFSTGTQQAGVLS